MIKEGNFYKLATALINHIILLLKNRTIYVKNKVQIIAET